MTVNTKGDVRNSVHMRRIRYLYAFISTSTCISGRSSLVIIAFRGRDACDIVYSYDCRSNLDIQRWSELIDGIDRANCYIQSEKCEPLIATL